MLDLIPGYAQAKAALRFIPYVGMGVLALVAALQYQSARHWSKVALNEKAAHAVSVERYKGAQRVAAELNKAKVERIEREYQIAGQKAEAEHEKLIANNRANLANWLRTQAAKGNTGGSATGQAATVSGESVQGTETPDLFATVPISDLEIVADAYAQLEALREWALSVGKVESK